MLDAVRSSRQYRVKAASVPAPVGGLNSRDSIDAMPPTDALIMSNFFPTTGKITLRDGFTQFCTGIDLAQSVIRTGFAFGEQGIDHGGFIIYRL